jgi:methionyl-tRNA synthetase
MLMSAGLALPRQVFGHGFITVDGQRMSKSIGNVVDPVDAAGRFGVDPLRLYLIKEVTYGGDPDFSWSRFQERYNADLANNLGNLVSRISAMAEKYRGSVLLPAASPGRLADVAAAAVAEYGTWMDALALERSAAAAFRIVDAANEYIAETEPWALARDDKHASRLSQVLYDVAEGVRVAALLLTPVIPASAAEILRRLGATDSTRLADAAWRNEGERRIQKGPALWPRMERTTVTDQPVKPTVKPVSPESPTVNPANPTVNPASPPNPTPNRGTPAPLNPSGDRITLDDFLKVDLRVAKVLAAEKVPNSRKLMKLSIDVGTEQRTLVAGIAEAYEPEQLVGRTVGIVFNLKPAKLMGIESNGMILAASPEGGKPTLVSFDGEVPPGSRIR